MAQGPHTGLLDLEKELTCSICTEVLYQPLTLLDCLHTFCGSCLKEWFSFEATQAKASKPYPFTCPSCRATVRDTRPNATVTTLLDMFVQANPERGRSEREKQELRKRYAPGENVIPKVTIKKETREEADDRRIIEEARELSLRDVGIRGFAPYERGTRHRHREGDSTPNTRASLQHASATERLSVNAQEEQRQIEHQSSLRSLLSNSDVDSSEIEEDFLRQVMDDGILDGIDLTTLDVSQEDELSERIAEAYRRRHNHRIRSRDTESDVRAQRDRPRQRIPSRERLRPTRQARSPPQTVAESNSSHPPLSRPHLFEAYPAGTGHGRRTSSETRTPNSSARSANQRVPSDTQRHAARSATDISSASPGASRHARTSSDTASNNARRTTDPDRLRPPAPNDRRSASVQRSSMDEGFERAPPPSRLDVSTHAQIMTNDRSREDGTIANGRLTNDISTADQEGRDHSPDMRQLTRQIPVPQRDREEVFPEPTVTCNRCGKSDLQYELHRHCDVCNDGNYDICTSCYRLGRGCLNWFGFGKAALQRHERQLTTVDQQDPHSYPHFLKGRRYLRPPSSSQRNALQGTRSNSTPSDPSSRLQQGPFCSTCSEFTPDCYWKCESCNEGEWGFCDACVRQGSCCTHPLLPVGLASYWRDKTHSSSISAPRRRTTSTTILPQSPVSEVLDPAGLSDPLSQRHEYVSLTVNIKCVICTYPISPSITRFHCFVCQDGDYDIDGNCYQQQVAQGSITTNNGSNGWRLCPQGHRMAIVGFEDSSSGQRRVVEKDMVGGRAIQRLETGVSAREGPEWKWQEQGEQKRRAARSSSGATNTITNNSAPLAGGSESSSNPAPTILKRFPPSGGAGMFVQALWGYWPQDGAADELAFPKGAELRECEDINGDWFWGVYCGRKGLFPGNFVRILGDAS